MIRGFFYDLTCRHEVLAVCLGAINHRVTQLSTGFILPPKFKQRAVPLLYFGNKIQFHTMEDSKTILYLFDVDGTLTKPRQIISEDMIQFLLDKVKPVAAIGLVSGSDYPKIIEQMNGEEVANQFDHLFCENGVVYYKNGELKSSESILTYLGEKPLQKVINFALSYMSKIELPVKRGNFVEFRSSMINFCPVGRSCSQTERDQFSEYDKEHKIREKFIEALQAEFSNAGLKFALGGQISIDVFPVGWDKTYCLNHVVDGNYTEIHFFGDKTFPGGNDHEIYNHERTIGHSVTSPDDTKHQVQQCLKLV